MSYVVNCDWLQLSVLNAHSLQFSEGTEIGDSVWRFRLLGGVEWNPYYSRSVVVKYRGQDAFHLFFAPRRPEVDKNFCSVKIANRMLYGDWLEILRAFLRISGLQINHLQRVDICCDFNTFENSLEPAKFIRRYFSAPTKTKPSLYRKGSNKFRAFGEKKTERIYFETLSFGTRDCPVQVNLYNKSRELKHKDKPWIRDCWKESGLDPERVWRVEFSMNPQGMKLEHLKFGYFTEVQIDDCSTYKRLYSLFTTLAQKYFVFYDLTLEDVKKGKRFRTDHRTPIKLFDFDFEPIFKHVSINRSISSGVSERNASRCLERFAKNECLAVDERVKVAEVAALLNVASQRITREAADDTLADTLLEKMMMSTVNHPRTMSRQGRDRLIHQYVLYLRGVRTDENEMMCEAFRRLDKELDSYIASLADVGQYAPPILVED